MITFAIKLDAIMASKQQMHPLLVSDNLINERGLMVFDDIHQMPIYHEPYIAPFFTVSLNVQGWVRAEYDMRPVRFQAHDIAIVHANHTLYAHESSADYHAILLAISPRMEQEMKSLTPSHFVGFYHYVLQPDFHLTDEQTENVVRLLLLLKSISESETQGREMILKGLLHILATLLQDYRRENGKEDSPLSPRQELFIRFHQAIVEHFRESREVRFYADLSCLTPKHFSTIIKQQTGINASDWISNYVMIQAKALLRHQQQLTVQQIAIRLGFPDQAAFSRYFKANEGVSPTEFREK
ncbi:MAG: helix-turn-helix domain-containing protein [Prevotella sp.]|nr:helix-turn-helix domain-containing protein [Prevotella sp.]